MKNTRSLPVWLKKNKGLILAFATILLIDQIADYMWLKPLYPESAGGLPERLLVITYLMYSFTYILSKVIDINWHNKH